MARKLNMKMKALFAMLMCGLSTFTVFPQTDYSKNTHNDAASITNESWAKTGKRYGLLLRRWAAGLNKKNNQLNNQPVPKKNEIKNKSNNRNATGVVLQHQSAYQYQGPIPPPEMMEKYKNIYADAPKIILQEFKENSEHIRQKELLEVQGTINRDRRGQWMAFVICMAILGVVFYSLYLGNITFAGLSGLGFIALIATGILKK